MEGIGRWWRMCSRQWREEVGEEGEVGTWIQYPPLYMSPFPPAPWSRWFCRGYWRYGVKGVWCVCACICERGGGERERDKYIYYIMCIMTCIMFAIYYVSVMCTCVRVHLLILYLNKQVGRRHYTNTHRSTDPLRAASTDSLSSIHPHSMHTTSFLHLLHSPNPIYTPGENISTLAFR